MAPRDEKDPKALFVKAWSQILAGRIANYLSGTSAGMKYESSSALILPLAEARSLLRSDPKVYNEFHPLFASTPMFNQHSATPFQLNWALGANAVPVAVSVNEELPTVALFGEMVPSFGARLLTVKGTAPDVPPPAPEVDTVISSFPPAATSLPGT